MGKTNLFMQGVTKLHFPKINEDVVYNEYHDKGGVSVADVSSFVEDGQFPILRVVHDKDERATILAVASRYEVLEE